jgi:hypothetical protein
MKVIDFGGTHSAHSIPQLEQLLRARFRNQENEFLLAPDASKYPYLSIMVRGDVAVLYYFPEGDHAGYLAVGGKLNLDLQEMTTFQIGGLDPGDTIDIQNEFIVPFSEALKVAEEFFHSQELPRSIEWFELQTRA